MFKGFARDMSLAGRRLAEGNVNMERRLFTWLLPQFRAETYIELLREVSRNNRKNNVTFSHSTKTFLHPCFGSVLLFILN
jgi:hypothetical protein